MSSLFLTEEHEFDGRRALILVSAMRRALALREALGSDAMPTEIRQPFENALAMQVSQDIRLANQDGSAGIELETSYAVAEE